MTTQQSSFPTPNDKIMAALAHISAILPFMGVIAPIIIWVTQKDKSEFVAFQALQAVAYQLLMILAWFIGMGCYMLSFLTIFLGIPFAGSNGGRINPAFAPLFAVGFVTPFLIFGAIFIGGAFFIIYGIIAAVQVFRGKDFRYMIIGKRLMNYLENNK